MNVIPFGKLSTGETVYKIKLQSSNQLQVEIINYGAIITHILFPDKAGNKLDMVLGYDDLAGYQSDDSYMGAIVGRYSGRIANGHFRLDGKAYPLTKNNGDHCLHGGTFGAHKKLWEILDVKSDRVTMGCRFVHKEDGFPGNLMLQVTYSLLNGNQLKIHYKATTDKPTHINLTQHSYFNLSGSANHSILKHLLKIDSSTFLPNNPNSVPTGELEQVQQTPLDFREAKLLKEALGTDSPQLVLDHGINHTFVLSEPRTNGLDFIAKLFCLESNIQLQVATTEPGLHVYGANYFDGRIIGKQQVPYQQYSGLCLETQHFPDSPNQLHFPSTRLDPGAIFESTTSYSFEAL